MVGANLKDAQLQQIVDKTIINADTDGDGKISFEEFCMVRNRIVCFRFRLVHTLMIALFIYWCHSHSALRNNCSD